jgi:hypothetical protein
VQWTRDGSPIPGATAPAYVVTDQDLHHKLAAALTTQLSGWPVDKREVAAPLVRAVPRFTVRGMRTDRPSSMRMGITASALGRQQGGSVRISMNDKLLKSLPLSLTAPAIYDFDAKPGAYALTLTYVGPAWMVQTKKTITVQVR